MWSQVNYIPQRPREGFWWLTEIKLLQSVLSEWILVCPTQSSTISHFHRSLLLRAASSLSCGGQAVSPDCLCPSGRASRHQSSVAGWRRRPLLHHNIGYSVTVCCGLATLITRQENNVDGKSCSTSPQITQPPRGADSVALLGRPEVCSRFFFFLLLNKRGAP